MRRILFALLVLIAPIAAHAEWREASTAHFVIYSQQSEERLRQFAATLERFDKGMRTLRPAEDEPIGKANRLAVYVLDDAEDVGAMLRDRTVAGFYVPRAGGSLAVIPRNSGSGLELDLKPLAILLHEYAHHYMWSAAPDKVYPAWFVEGFAEFHATARFAKDGGISFGEPPLYRGVGLMSGNLLPIEKLLVADTRKLTDEQREAMYGRGWLLTHYLFTGPRNAQLGKYIDALNDGTPPLEAARAAFGDLRTLDRELERYKRGSLRVVNLTGARLAIGDIAIRTLRPGEAAMMDIRIRSKVGVNTKTAPGVYADARKAAASFPNDAAAQVILAGTALDAGDLAGAEAAADRALAADPKSVEALLHKAQAETLAARAAGIKDKARWAAIRKRIIAANRLDPEDPRPLIRNYMNFLDAGDRPNRAAKDGLARALELAPQDRGLRFLGAGMYLHEGDPASARRQLAPLAYQPHATDAAARAQKLIALIDAAKVAEALADLEVKDVEGPSDS